MTWFDIVVLAICGVSCVRGYMTGFVMQLASLVGVVLGAIFAGTMAEKIYPHLDALLHDTVNVAGPLSYVVGFIVILIAVYLIGRLVDSLMTVTLLSTANKIAGAAFCLGKWILLISILLNLMVGFDINKKIVKAEIREKSKSYPILIVIAQIVIPYLRFEEFIPSDSEDTTFRPSITTV